MSTKTTFKRIALVAVAALGLGVLSVAPSNASVSNQTFTVTNGTATQTVSDSTTAAIVNVSGLISTGGAALAAVGLSGDTVTVGFLQKTIPATALGASIPKMALVETNTAASQSIYKVITGGSAAGLVTQVAGSNTYVLNNSESVTAGVALAEGFSITRAQAGYYGAKFILQLDSVTAPTAGTYTYTVVVTTYSVPAQGGAYTVTQATQDVSIVVAAAASAATAVNVTNSFARLNATTAVTTSGVDATITSVSTASATAVGFVYVGVRNAEGSSTTVAQDSITATITGAGILSTGSITGSSFKIAATGDKEFSILPDGRAGVATITITTNGATYSPKTVTFYAKAAKTVTATVAHPVLKIGANTGAVSVTAVDTNGTNWTGTAYIVASAAADALVAGSATTPVACAAYNATDGILCPITAIAAGTAKFKVIDASTVALATATSSEVTVTVSSATANTVKLAFDKSTYGPSEKATITVTPVDVAGKNIAGQTLANLFATGGITSTLSFSAGSDTLTAVSVITDPTTSALKYTVYMPAASGDVTISATGGTSLPAAGQVKVSATASVVNSSVDAATDAANEATDAANAATDAALAAADAADAATAAAEDASAAVATLATAVNTALASLKKQITALAALVKKLLKK